MRKFLILIGAVLILSSMGYAQNPRLLDTAGDNGTSQFGENQVDIHLTDAEINQQKEVETNMSLLTMMRGRIAYAKVTYPTNGPYISFDVETPSVTTQVGPTFGTAQGGDYFNGFLYTYENVGKFMKIQSSTGEVIQEITGAWNTYMADMAYDYSTGTMYGVRNLVLYSINLETGVPTIVANLTGTPVNTTMQTLAVDLDGNMYGITTSSAYVQQSLYSINKTTGVCTEIGSTGKYVMYNQSMGFDHYSGILYWVQMYYINDWSFCTVNTSTGFATTIGNPGYELTCFHIPFDFDPEAPASVTDLTVIPGNSGALSATISWTNPSQTYDGGTLTSISSVSIYENNGETPIHTVSNPAPGSSGNHSVVLSETGVYTYKVKATNEAGDSPPKTVSVWIGPDVPDAPENITSICIGDDIVLEWTAPALGLHGGWIDTSSLTYDITRNPDNVSIVTGHGETTFTDTTLPDINMYSYSITAVNNAGIGGTASVAAVQCGGQLEIPYSMGFEDNELWQLWTIVNDNCPGGTGANGNWQRFNGVSEAHTGTYSMRHQYHGSCVDNDWVFSPELPLKAGVDYRVKFWLKTGSAFVGNEKLALHLASGASPDETIGEPLWFREDLRQNYSEFSVLVTVETSNLYRFGFRKYSDINLWGISIDDFLVEVMPTGPAIRVIPQPIDLGTVYNNLPFQDANLSVPKIQAVENTGAGTLTVSDFSNFENPEVTVTELPISIDVNSSENIKIRLNGSGQPTGPYTGEFILNSNCSVNPKYKVDVKANIQEAVIVEPCEENWDEGNPLGWTYRTFSRMTGGGVDNSPFIRANINSYTTQPAMAQTPYTYMGNNPTITFDFRATAYPGTNPAPPNSFRYNVLVSPDNGVTWIEVYTINFGENTDPGTWQTIMVPSENLTDFTGELCIVQFLFYCDRSMSPYYDIYMNVDNVFVGTPLYDELATLSITGLTMFQSNQPVEHVITIRNNGANTQTSDDYSVKLMMEGDIQIGVLPGETIVYKETKEFSFTWTPTVQGTTYIYGVIDFQDDEYPDNNITDNKYLMALSENNKFIDIGDGQYGSKLPMDLYYRKSMSQSIYYPLEIGSNGGEIQALVYYPLTNYFSELVASKRIKVWIGDLAQENLADGWIDPATLTEVFDGNIALDSKIEPVIIPLQTPYLYNGENLAIYIYKYDAIYHNSLDYFLATYREDSYRSRNYYVDGIVGQELNYNEPSVTSAGTILNYYPNVTMVFNMSGIGSLTGTVFNDSGNILEGVKVQILDSNLSTFTDIEGVYSFQYLVPGSYEVEFSYHAHFSKTITIGITANTETNWNVTLDEFPKVKLSGTVTSNDGSGSGLEGVKISLSGLDPYSTTSVANGYYEIEGVYANQVYDIRAMIARYYPHFGTIEIGATNEIYNFEMIDIPYPVGMVSVEEIGYDAAITWTAAGELLTKTYILDDGSAESGLNFISNDSGWVGNQFIVNEVGELTSVDIYGWGSPGGTRTVTVDIFNEARELVGSSEHFMIPSTAWVNVPLNYIPFSGTFYAMVHWHATPGDTYYLGLDTNGPNATANLDWFLNNAGVWALLNTAPGIPKGVCMIRANADVIGESVYYGYSDSFPESNSAENVEANGIVFKTLDVAIDAESSYESINAKSVGSKGVNSYKIYRLSEGSPEEDWEELDDVTGLAYTDHGWATIGLGDYKWAVKAKYPNDILSDATLSNTLIKDIVRFSVTVASNNSDWGTVTGGGIFEEGESITVEANANEGCLFVNWTKDGEIIIGAGAEYQFSVTESCNLVANFAVNTYTVNVSANPTAGGTANGGGTFEHGQSATVTADANEGYHFVNWTKDGAVIHLLPDYSFTVTESVDLVANFAINSYTVNVAANPTIGGSVSGGGTFNHGQSATVTANANEGYHFLYWTENDVEISDAGASYTFVVTDNHNLVANFAINNYTVNVAANPTNGGSVTGGGTFNHGQNATVNANPNEGYHFINWTKDGTVIHLLPDYSFTVTESVDLVANFAINTYTVNVEAYPVEGGTVAGGGSNFEHGTEIQITAIANDNYNFVNWTEIGGGIIATTPNATVTVERNMTLRANFVEQGKYFVTLEVNPTGAGTVDGDGEYYENEEVTIEAIANLGWGFLNWKKSGEIVHTEPKYSFVITENVVLVANFELIPVNYKVTFNVIEEDGGAQIMNAMIVFNGIELESYIAENVPVGIYDFIVTKEGYFNGMGTVEVINSDVDVDVKLTKDVGIMINSLSEVVLYPNPFTNEINISNPNAVKGIQITNAAGQKVKKVVFDGKSITTSELANGIYFVTIENFRGDMVVYKMIKK